MNERARVPLAAVLAACLPWPAAANPVSLAGFEAVQFFRGNQPENADWSLNTEQTWVGQLNNNEPSYFLSDVVLDHTDHQTLLFSVYVDSADDDGWGFVWGYHDRAEHYGFVWSNTSAPGFMAAWYLDAGSVDPFCCFPPGGDAGNFHSTETRWINQTLYDIRLDLRPGGSEVIVADPGGIVQRWTVDDARFPSGRFGFYTESLGAVWFGDLRIITPGTPCGPDLSVCSGDITTTGTGPSDLAYGLRDCRVDLADLQYFLTHWQHDDPVADVNTTGSTNGVPDGDVDLSDLQYFLTRWQAGRTDCR